MLNEQGKEVKRFKVSNRSGELFGALLKHYEINMQSVLLRRELLIKEQLSFITSLKYCPDHNLFMEIASRYPVGVTHEFIVKYRLVDDSLSRRTVDIAASEVKFTLDKIVDRAPMLRQQFSKEFEQAYNKLHYYEAIAAIYRNDRKQAQQELRAVISTRVEYLLLYLLLYIPLPNNKILRILGR